MPALPTDPRAGVDDPAGPSKPIVHTTLTCLVYVARTHGIDLSVGRLAHDYNLGNEEPSTVRLLRICRDAGLKAKTSRLRWEDLSRLGPVFPVLARLRNGNTVVVVGVRERDGRHEIGVLDPLASGQDILPLERDAFCASWSGEVVLMKRRFRIDDRERPFDLLWFLPELARQWRCFRDVGVAVLVLHLLALVTPLFFQIVVDKVLVHESRSTLHVLVLGVVIALLFEAMLVFLRRILLLHATNRIDIRVAVRVFTKLLSLPIDFFDRSSTGVLIKHMQQAEKVREFLTGRLFVALLDVTALLVFIPALLLYSVPLTLVVLVFTLLIAAVIAVLIRPFQRRLTDLYMAEGERQSLLVETITGMRTVKSLAMEPRQTDIWSTRSAHTVTMHFNVGRISTVAQALTGLFEKLMAVSIIWVGAELVFDGAITVGTLIAFQMLAGRVSQPLVQIVGLVHEYQEVSLAVRMLGEIMNRPSERIGPQGGSRGLRPALRGRIEFSGVSLSYGADRAPVLDRVSFTVREGGIFGIVGRSGSGKTTVTRLIQGLYPPQQGIIRIDGVDIREFDLVHLRSNVGIVLQDSFLFRGTVRDNIATAKPDALFEEIVEAARLAGALEFIEQLPRGFDTWLDENGANLSGGQKQRLAIARALVRQPRILILDEATSALDPESEAIIQANLKDIARNRTLIVVSHRLSTLADADTIMVLDRGTVSDIGTHQELIRRCRIYNALWTQQMRHSA